MNASAPVYPHLNSNQVIFIKMSLPTMEGGWGSKAEIYISSGPLCNSGKRVGNLFLSVAAQGDSKGADSAFLEYQNRLDENAARQRAVTNINAGTK